MPHTPHRPLRISYCTTCKGRLHHLQQTLPANLKAEEGNPNVEFVVLDYGSEDGLGDWIKSNFQREIDSGRLVYARTEAPYFKMAHAKNMAHRLANGDVLCNLDADNFIANDFSTYLRGHFEKHPDTILGAGLLTRAFKNTAKLDGISGRMAYMRKAFGQLDGYDEAFKGWGGEDINFKLRGRDLGLAYKAIPNAMLGSVITHSNEERMDNLHPSTMAASHSAVKRGGLEKFGSVIARQFVRARANSNPPGWFGCGEVQINFSDSVTRIKPIGVSLPVPRFVQKALERELAESWPQDNPSQATRREPWATSCTGERPPQAHRR